MREQLESYVNSLFAGSPDAEDMRQEILMNTLDRYDDLIDQGKSAQEAYRLAIAGIGDVEELMGRAEPVPTENSGASRKRSILRAVAVALYILCVVPVIMLENTAYEDSVGVPIMFLMIAAATALLILTGRGRSREQEASGRKKKYSVTSAIWWAGLAVYLIVSFLTNAWLVTWLIFPMVGCINGILRAAFDLKEAK